MKAGPSQPEMPTTGLEDQSRYLNVSLLVSGNPDILICGNCREMFTELQDLLDHKKTYCKLRFTCKCHTLNGVKTSE
jgi:uncharacterized CHY-type Zn-finger protein